MGEDKKREPVKRPPKSHVTIQDAGDAGESEVEILCRQIGHQWPPRDQPEAVSILTKAQFAQERIDQFLAMRFGGFEGVGDMPRGYVSTGPATGPLPGKNRDDYPTDRVLTPDEHAELYGGPVFSAMLIEGLRKAVKASGSESGDGHQKKQADFAAATDPIPQAYRDNTNEPIGPLTGPASVLARAVTGRDKARKDDLLKKHTHHVVFVRSTGDREFEVYFPSVDAMVKARDRLPKATNDV